ASGEVGLCLTLPCRRRISSTLSARRRVLPLVTATLIVALAGLSGLLRYRVLRLIVTVSRHGHACTPHGTVCVYYGPGVVMLPWPVPAPTPTPVPTPGSATSSPSYPTLTDRCSHPRWLRARALLPTRPRLAR